jgi:Arc/MetJ-type ribon-helix-helix transcriptional regulator
MRESIQMTLPARLHQQVRALVTDGWFRDETELLVEALRRFLDVHRPDLMERFLRDDVAWGLHGTD